MSVIVYVWDKIAMNPVKYKKKDDDYDVTKKKTKASMGTKKTNSAKNKTDNDPSSSKSSGGKYTGTIGKGRGLGNIAVETTLKLR